MTLGAISLVVFIIWLPLAGIGFLINRDEERASRELEALKEWEAEVIIRRLQGRSIPVRPSHTNSSGPM